MSKMAETKATARIDINPPRLLTTGAVFTESAYGVLLGIPALISMLVVSVLPFGALTFLLPLLTVGVGAYFLPFAFGNPYIARLIRSLRPAGAAAPEEFMVQLTLRPRLRFGMRALIE